MRGESREREREREEGVGRAVQGAQERHTSIRINRDCLDTTKTAERHTYSYPLFYRSDVVDLCFLTFCLQEEYIEVGKVRD